MLTDENNKYRDLLNNDPPTFQGRIDNPWENRPDLMDFNRKAFNRISRSIKAIQSDPNHKSRGFLVLGEAGTGKTHLLMRVAREFSTSKKDSSIISQILFVRRPNNEEAVAQNIWDHIVTSLNERVGDSQYSQLDDLLAHIFSKVLCEMFSGENATEQQKRWKNDLEKSPYSIFNRLGNGERREKNKNFIKRHSLTYIKNNEPLADQLITEVLIKYCLYARDTNKTTLLEWLRGRDISDEEAKQLQISPSWIQIDETETTNQNSINQLREEFALKAIQTIGVLSKYYHPLIIAFDQLEGLRDKPTLTSCWGDTIREIFTGTPNVLIITCIFPSLWETWFKENLDKSAQDRIAEDRITLDPFSYHFATPLLQEHMRSWYNKYHLPTRIYPLEEKDIQEICENQQLSLRDFLQESQRRISDWLDGEDPLPLPPPKKDEIDKKIEGELDIAYKRNLKQIKKYKVLEENFFGQINLIIEKYIQYQNNYKLLSKATYNNRVMPYNIIVRDILNNKDLCFGVLNKTGIAFTSRIRNIIKVSKDRTQFDKMFIARTEDSDNLGATSKDCVRLFEEEGGQFRIISREEIALYCSIYDMLVQIEEHDLSFGEHKITFTELFDYIIHNHLMDKNLFLVSDVFTSSINNHNGETIPPENDENLTTNEKDDQEKSKEANKEHKKHPLVVGNRQGNLTQGGMLGKLLQDERKIFISFEKPICCGIYGYMGSGKSYALGVLIENSLLNVDNLITNRNPTSVVAFNYRRNSDVSFEYASFAKPNSNRSDFEKLLSEYEAIPQRVEKINILGYEHELNERREEYLGINTFPIKFLPNELNAEHWSILMKPPTANTEYMSVINDIISDLSYQHKLTLENLELEIKDHGTDRLNSTQIRCVENRLSFAKKWITDKRNYSWSDIFSSGSLSIFDLRMTTTPKSDILSLCLILTDIVRSTKNNVNKTIVFDEAHEYVDENDRSSKNLISDLENAILQMRHDGVSFILATQYPMSIPQNILKHLLTRIIFKIPDSSEIKYLQKSSPNLQTLSQQSISNLDLETGICYFQSDDDCSDLILRQPQKVTIRPRCSLHGGETKRSI